MAHLIVCERRWTACVGWCCDIGEKSAKVGENRGEMETKPINWEMTSVMPWCSCQFHVACRRHCSEASPESARLITCPRNRVNCAFQLRCTA
ncbi:uncharacterized protein YALI1_A01868g [Yarrowia lipolytica]|uniref:Uncharacterized protein n=1 Tax=Yarrowia lipolytica TaxID=4952 RepID=A0A1D8N3E8_YARLL|nr:hypothetical protein YALI1_A01868g [Yarrowia lipolytica]